MTIAAPVWFLALFGTTVGAVFGSFLNVLIYRVPRGMSVISPPSTCPSCQTRIQPYDNVPILGWLLLGGKCRGCRAHISIRYPAVEALTAAVFLALTLRYGLTLELMPALYFAGAMIAVTFIDWDVRIIPDRITLTGVPLGIASSWIRPELGWLDAVIGAAAGFAFLYVVAEGYYRLTGRDGLGGGDIKLAAMLGAFLGWQGVLLTVFLSSFAGTIVAVALMASGKGGRFTALPFGTFLGSVSAVVYVYGAAVINAYLSMFQAQ